MILGMPEISRETEERENSENRENRENRGKKDGEAPVLLFSDGDKLTAKLTCELDHHAARPIREEIDRALKRERPKLLVIDFSSVHFMDSSGIGLILGRLSLCDEIGCLVHVLGLSPTLLRIVRLTGMEKLSHLTIAEGGQQREPSRR